MNSYQIIYISFHLLTVLVFTQSLIECPNQKTKCSDGMTCCEWSSSQWGCCPFTSAVCCADSLHCCPSGTKCNDKNQTCDDNILNKPIQMKTTFKVDENRVCPDKNQTCPEDQTCCREKTGRYGCCPYNLGVCCSDGLHCCPHGTRCDLKHSQCVRANNRVTDNSLIKLNGRMRLIGFSAKNITNITCPGGQYDCPDRNTCCLINDRIWGCCPLVDAVCCDDRSHCCPKGTKCSESKCINK